MTRRATCGAAMVAACGLAAACAPARAGEAAVAASADAALLTAYVWRGQVVNDEPVLQPAVTAGRGGFAANVWGNFNLTDNITEDPDFSELDVTLSYGRGFGPVGVSAGWIEYSFPNTAFPSTREVYAGLSLQGWAVVPSLTAYYDVDEADGVYAQAGLAWGVALCASAKLTLTASLAWASGGFNEYYYGVDGEALNDLGVGAAVAWSAAERLTVTGGVQYSDLLDGDIADAAEELYFDTTAVVGSIKVGYTF